MISQLKVEIAVYGMKQFTESVGKAQRALKKLALKMCLNRKRPQNWRSPKPMHRRRETRIQYRYRMHKQYGGTCYEDLRGIVLAERPAARRDRSAQEGRA